MPKPAPETKPTGGVSKKQNAMPSAALPSYILKSNTAFHWLHDVRFIGWLKNTDPLCVDDAGVNNSSELPVPVTLVTVAAPCKFQPEVFIGEPVS